MFQSKWFSVSYVALESSYGLQELNKHSFIRMSQLIWKIVVKKDEKKIHYYISYMTF